MATAALIGGLILTAVGTGVQVSAARQAARAQEANIAAQKRAESARFAGLEIDANRRRREMIRQGIIARAQARASATAANAQFGSALPGAFGQIAGLNAFNIAGVGLGQQIGAEQFAANVQGLEAKRGIAQAGSLGATGEGISSLGGALTKNIGPINRLFGT